MTECVCAMAEKRQRYSWTRELDLLLEQGYRSGLAGRRATIDRIESLTGWPRQACWDRARKLDLTQQRLTPLRQWTPVEEQRLISLAGSRNVRFIAQRLNRSVPAVRTRLSRAKEAGTRVRDGLTKTELAKLTGRSLKTIQRWIELGWLKGRYEGKLRVVDTLRVSDEQSSGVLEEPPRRSPLASLEP